MPLLSSACSTTSREPPRHLSSAGPASPAQARRSSIDRLRLRAGSARLLPRRNQLAQRRKAHALCRWLLQLALRSSFKREKASRSLRRLSHSRPRLHRDGLCTGCGPWVEHWLLPAAAAPTLRGRTAAGKRLSNCSSGRGVADAPASSAPTPGASAAPGGNSAGRRCAASPPGTG